MICDNSAKGGELIMKLTGCPGFFVDHPYGHSDEEKKYLVNELRGMIDFLEKESGNKMNWNRLAEIVERMNRQIKLFREINELRKAVPSPFGPQRFLELVSIDYLFPGQLEAIEYLETLRGELEDMVKQKKGATSPEHFRLMTMFIPPLHLSAFLTEISIEYGAVSVTEPFFTLFESGELDPARPLESVAQKSFMLPEMLACGPLDQNTIDSFVQCARDYKVDGVIYYADVGCRQSCACIKIFKDAFNDIDVPMLTLDCDIIDDTVVTKEEVREKLTHFFELLEERR
jgi:benzoyl-CoA reductase/2-hydroxyglutaryl-CoA dehydratase subunit BcrC/BadD/HgdB